MAEDSTPLGLLTRGPLSSSRDAADKYLWDVDYNARKMDELIQALRNEIESIVVTGLPDTIDAGTF